MDVENRKRRRVRTRLSEQTDKTKFKTTLEEKPGEKDE